MCTVGERDQWSHCQKRPRCRTWLKRDRRQISNSEATRKRQRTHVLMISVRKIYFLFQVQRKPQIDGISNDFQTEDTRCYFLDHSMNEQIETTFMPIDRVRGLTVDGRPPKLSFSVADRCPWLPILVAYVDAVGLNGSMIVVLPFPGTITFSSFGSRNRARTKQPAMILREIVGHSSVLDEADEHTQNIEG